MNLRRLTLSVPTLATLALMFAGACSLPATEESGDEALAEAEEALCADGTIPGCGTCDPDPSSPLGGYQTCWTCNDSTSTKSCTPPPPCGGTGQACCNTATQCVGTLHCNAGICVQPRCDHAGDTCCYRPSTNETFCQTPLGTPYGVELICSRWTTTCYWAQ